ncbi:MAG: hypothetical protein AAF125_10070 [Chloroflexota bacterium]
MFNSDKKKKTSGSRINIYTRFAGKEGESIPYYHPGDDMVGVVNIDVTQSINVNRIDIELGWETEGKGDRDREVIDRDVIDAVQLVPDDAIQHPFSFVAPRMPWSYDGTLIRVVWYLTVKVDVKSALDVFNMQDAEQKTPFILRP